MRDSPLPDTSVVLELSDAFKDEGRPGLDQAKAAAQTRLERTMADLGMPGGVALTVTVADSPEERTSPLSITVDGRRCRYPDELIGQLAEIALGAHATTVPIPAEVAEEVRLTEDPAALPHFLACACEEIVKIHPSWLLSDSQAEAYGETLRASHGLSPTEWPPERLVPLLRALLELWIPISDTGRLVSALSASGGDPFERAIAALRPAELHIELAAWLLHALTEVDDSDRLASFDEMRQSVYDDLGVRLPILRFSPVDAEASTALRFRVNGLRTAPVLGLAPDEVLIHLPWDNAKDLGVQARPAWDPWLGSVGAIVDISAQEALAQSVFMWNSWEHLVNMLGRAARQHAPKLVDMTTLEQDLGVLVRDCPELVGAARSQATVDEVVATLRTLLAERVPVRDLPRIVRTAVEWHDTKYVPRPRLRSGYEPASDNLPAFVRLALAGQIAQQLTVDGSDTLLCHLIDPVTETMLVAADPLPEADRVRFLTAVQAGIQSQPPSFGSSVVLTSASAREKVLAAIHEELPGVAVLAFDELPAQVMVDWQWLPVTS